MPLSEAQCLSNSTKLFNQLILFSPLWVVDWATDLFHFKGNDTSQDQNTLKLYIVTFPFIYGCKFSKDKWMGS